MAYRTPFHRTSMAEFQFTPEMKRALRSIVEARRKSQSMTLALFIEAMGISPRTWSRLSIGSSHGVTEQTLKLVAEALGTTAAALHAKIVSMAAPVDNSIKAGPVKFKSEVKTWVPASAIELSQSLLDAALPLPTFADAVRGVESTSLTDAQKDMGVLGDPAYNHFVQVSLVITCKDRFQSQLLFYRRKDDRHDRTIGGSVLYSKPIVWRHKNIPTPLDRWMLLADRNPAQAERVMLRGDMVEELPHPIAIELLAGRVCVPRDCSIASIVPLCVVTNNQVGKVRHDGKPLRTVYTSFVYHLHVTCADPIEANAFSDMNNDRLFFWMPVLRDDAALRNNLRNPEDGRVNVLDYLVAKRVAGVDGVLRCDEPNGCGLLRPGFRVV